MSIDLGSRLDTAYTEAQHGRFEDRATFLEALQSPQDWLRLKAAEMLGQIGQSWAVTPLGALLDDRESSVRNEAIHALSRVARSEAVSWLIKALQDEDQERRDDARVALFQILGEQVPIASEVGEDDPDEAERVARWWEQNVSRFQRGTCYYRGHPVSLGEWIASLDGATKAHRVWVATRLHWWTGLEPASPSSPDFVRKWEDWWRDNFFHYPPGRRFFYGHVVNGAAEL